MRNWQDLVPLYVALEQTAWERRQQVLRGRQAGMKLRELGSVLGVGKERIRQIICRATRERNRRAPVERYVQERGEVAAMVDMIKQAKPKKR